MAKVYIVKASAFVSGAIGRFLKSRHAVPEAREKLEG